MDNFVWFILWMDCDLAINIENESLYIIVGVGVGVVQC